MADSLRIALAQLNQRLGDIPGNAQAVLQARKAAGSADLVVFPELHLIGYPPEDLVLKPAMVEKAAAHLQMLAEATASPGPALLVGAPFVLDGALHNGVALLDQGRVAAVRLKHELPNYGTFDEKRLFQPGPLPEPVVLRGTMIGVPICEDIWQPDVCRHLADFGAEMFVCINGSPWEADKETLRIENVAKRRAVDTGLPLAYLNRVGGQDELVFDGASFMINGDGSLAVQARDWEEQIVATHWTRTAQGWRCDRGELSEPAAHPEDTYSAVVLALRDYVERSDSRGVVLGLDGGIDSALCGALAIDALGAPRVWGVAMPSRFTPALLRERALACARMLGIRFTQMPIGDGVDAMEAVLGEAFEGTARDGAEESLRARLRATALMALSNKFGPMVLSCANKSDLSLGATTLYGALAGGFAPLKDVYRTQVLELARWRNRNVPRIGSGIAARVIPEALLAAAAEAPQMTGPRSEVRSGLDSAELDACVATRTLDADEAGMLPDYDILDAILKQMIEHDRSAEQLVTEGFSRDTVRRIENLLHAAEFKRRQSPPGVKLSARNFGRDRRYPISHAFRTL